ncbi:interaptin isoform X1 [Scleropages formosus]|uniref:Myosin phosphatase Rho interacting protein n=2 Tax=Scleropages formosus TaxID=113540 RepID=A0A8C9V8M5_SCLFO|nr:interaptin-like isoform X1 [Scleropages formosus]
MSSAKENPCRKFQANIFNKSKCQNCFKPRELHLLSDQDLNQAKPIYGGWLCLAPEGTDFDNPVQRSRKWQRRFFVLYEHGCLRFALDESPSTLPQGTVNMNLCTDVIDAEPRTGQKNALCIITPDQEYYIRGENKEIINGWSEQLVVYPRTNKQNQKKKRKVEPTTSQEPGPAKVAVTGLGIPEAEKIPDSRSMIWQEELHNKEADVGPAWPSADVVPLSTPLSPTGEGIPVDLNSDGGSINGDEVDRGGLPLHTTSPQHPLDILSPAGSTSSRHSGELGGVPRCLSPAPSDPFPSGSSLLSNGSHISGSMSSLDSDASGSTVTSTDSHVAEPAPGWGHRVAGAYDAPRSRRLEVESRKAEKRSRIHSPDLQGSERHPNPETSRSNVIEKLEALELENAERMEVEEASCGSLRQGRSETRRFQREEKKHDLPQGLDFTRSTLPPLRRAKSLDRRTTESVMTPDLLNFKKGWMVKLDEQGQWKKYWFVLTDHSLRYYKDSIAEEASDLDGEIDLTTCFNVTEYQVQRNYGFQIHTQEAVYTLSAMTAGIRRNWIQAVMKNVRPSTAPDVASLTDDHGPCGPLESLLKPDITQDSLSSETSSVEREPGLKRSRARDRRREGRSKTFDWAEFRPIAQALAQQRAREADAVQAELGDIERNRRREERRKRYESVTGSSLEPTGVVLESSSHGDVAAPLLERQKMMQEEIEQRWQQVERTPIREERRVPLSITQARATAELENLLESYKQSVEELKQQLDNCHQQLIESNHHKLELEVQLKTALEREQQIRTGYISPLDPPLGLEAELESQKKRQELVSSQAQNLKKKYQETKELLQQQELKKRSMQAQLGLSLSPLSTKEPSFSNVQSSAILQSDPFESDHTKTICITLQDAAGTIQEVEDLISGNPLTLKGLLQLLGSHGELHHGDFFNSMGISNQISVGDRPRGSKLTGSLKYQQESEDGLLKNSGVHDYDVHFLSMEGLLERAQRQKMESLKSPYGPLCQIEEHSEANEVTIRKLSQKLELLMNENEVLNQRYQEIMNQLTEADREIERLKEQLFDQQGGHEYQMVMEELNKMKVHLTEREASSIDKEFYERELNKKSQKLQEALRRLEVLGNNLKDTERKLQLKEATLSGLGFQMGKEINHELLLEEKAQLHHQLQATEAKLSEVEKQLRSAELSCHDLQAQNAELRVSNQETGKVHSQKFLDMQSDVMLKEKAVRKSEEGERVIISYKEAGFERLLSDEKSMQQVIEDIKIKSEALSKVSEVLGKVDMNVERTLNELISSVSSQMPSDGQELVDMNEVVMRKLLLEGEFWGRLLNVLVSSPQSNECEFADSFLHDVAERMIVEKRMLVLASKLFSLPKKERHGIGLKAVEATDTTKSHESFEVCENTENKIVEADSKDISSWCSWLDDDTNKLIKKDLMETLQGKVFLLNQILSAIQTSTCSNNELQSLVLRLCDFENREKGWFGYVQDAVMEAHSSYLISRLDVQRKVLKQMMLQGSCATETGCQNYAKLLRENKELRTKLENMQKKVLENKGPKTEVDKPVTHIHIDGEPIDSLDKAIQLQDMVAKHKKELREVKDAYEQETEKLRLEVARAGETLRLRSEENVKEIDSLTICMENLKRKHEMERKDMEEHFNKEIEALRSTVAPDGEDISEPGRLHSMSSLKERIQELEGQVSIMTEEMKRRECEGHAASLRLKYKKDLEKLKDTCERGFAAMEESHQKVIEELQRKHQRELENLQEEKDRLLAEETAATIAAIEAMKNAHRTELERELEKARKANSSTENADIEEIRKQHDEELSSFQREIEVLSEQYSQKCLENAHLAQALEAERQALRQCQRENQELNAHNQELNNRLAAEITKLRSMTSEDGGDSCTMIHGKEVYELEVMLRVKESEVQYLKQEINSLKDELQAAQRDKKYATDKYKDIYTELSIVRAKAERDLGRLREQLQLAHEALGESSLEDVERGSYDIMKSKSNPDILKMAAAAAKRSERTMRSKSLKEGLTAEQRLHLFDNKETKEF